MPREFTSVGVIGLGVMAVGYGVLVTLQFDSPLWTLLLAQLFIAQMALMRTSGAR
mgnify:CR=1 FL=1